MACKTKISEQAGLSLYPMRLVETHVIRVVVESGIDYFKDRDGIYYVKSWVTDALKLYNAAFVEGTAANLGVTDWLKKMAP